MKTVTRKRYETHGLPKWFRPAIFAAFAVFAALVYYGPPIITEIVGNLK